MNTYIEPCGCRTQANFVFERKYLVKPCDLHAKLLKEVKL